MSRRSPPRPLLLAAALALGVWAFVPVLLFATHAAATHAVWTGSDSLIGADGVLGVDQLQYLAWARSIADHGLAADLFTLGPSGHVYLEPASGLLGGLLWLGVPLAVGACVLTGIGVLVLAGGASAWVGRLLPGGPGERLVAVALALFTLTPATALVNWLQLGSARFRFAVYLAGDELLPASKLWGYVPAALALGLLALTLLGLERALAEPSGSGRARWLALTAAGALLCGWLHPWQGITLAVLLLGLTLVRRRARELGALALVLAAALLPLAYYAVLSHADPAWRLAAGNEAGPRLPASVLGLCLGPLVLIALPGVRRPRGELAEQALLLWVPAALLAYFAHDAFATHALQGITLPVGVLAVRGARRVRLPVLAGGACAVLLTLPGLAYDARKIVRTSQSPLVQYALPRPDAAAMRWIERSAPPGGVLAPTPLAAVVPSRTGRAVWVGHGDWSPHYRRRARAADRLFDGGLSPRAGARFATGTGARLLLVGCAHAAPALPGAVRSRRRFGCASVLVLRRSPPGVSSRGGRPRR